MKMETHDIPEWAIYFLAYGESDELTEEEVDEVTTFTTINFPVGYTMDVKWDKRLWRFVEADALDVEAGVVSAALPTGAFAWIVNLVTDDGLVFSTPYRETK